MPVETRRVPLSELRVPAPRVEAVSTHEASMRLDALASAGELLQGFLLGGWVTL